MKTKGMVLALVVAAVAAVSVQAVELRAYVGRTPNGCKPIPGWGVGWVIVNPAYVPPVVNGVPAPDPCVVTTIPANATQLGWCATELWEFPPRLSDSEKRRLAGSVETYNGWTHLSCFAQSRGAEWYYSCFSSGLEQIGGAWQRHPTGIRVEGTHSGTLSHLDAIVRAWWQAQR